MKRRRNFKPIKSVGVKTEKSKKGKRGVVIELFQADEPIEYMWFEAPNAKVGREIIEEFTSRALMCVEGGRMSGEEGYLIFTKDDASCLPKPNRTVVAMEENWTLIGDDDFGGLSVSAGVFSLELLDPTKVDKGMDLISTDSLDEILQYLSGGNRFWSL
jgi:hypothetical protein